MPGVPDEPDLGPESVPADVRSALAWASSILEDAGVPSASVDAEILLATVASVPRGSLALAPALTDDQRVQFSEIVSRRATREPLQHILGVAWFRHLELQVGPGVFVPRPETELLVDLVPEDARVIVDACSGSGAIALALSTERAGATVVAAELSDEACAWLERNVAAHREELARRASEVIVVQADVCLDWSSWLEPVLQGRALDAVASNPPYIPSAAVPLEPEARDHDPELALYSGDDGLTVIRGVATQAAEWLRDGGVLAIEHADVQGEAVPEVLALLGTYEDVVDHRDLAGRPRTTTARRASGRMPRNSSRR